jgi:hypothetical protein
MAQLQETGITGSLEVTDTTNATSYALLQNKLGGISGAVTINITSGSYISADIEGGTSFQFTGAPTDTKSSSFILELQNGGLYAVVWPANIQWENSETPILSYQTGPVTVDILVFTTDDGGQTLRGSLSVRNAKPAPT